MKNGRCYSVLKNINAYTWHGNTGKYEMGGSILCKTVKENNHLSCCLDGNHLNSDSYDMGTKNVSHTNVNNKCKILLKRENYIKYNEMG